MRKVRRFTEREDEFIKANIGRLGCTDIARHLDRNPASVVSRATTLGLRKPNRTVRRFTAKEDGFIRSHAGKLSLQEISERLGRSTGSVYGRGRKLGVFFDRKKRTARPTLTSQGYVRIPIEEGGKRRWTLEHIYIAEQAIGRRLQGSEQIHHINFHRRDNQLENLHLFSDGVAHNNANASIFRLVNELLGRSTIRFNRDTGEYELCETSK